jgi:hypothetical protein
MKTLLMEKEFQDMFSDFEVICPVAVIWLKASVMTNQINSACIFPKLSELSANFLPGCLENRELDIA